MEATPPWNMTFALFLVDPRPHEELCRALGEKLGGRFEQDLEYKADGRIRYTSRVFGLELSCLREQIWDSGAVYRFSGDNDNSSRFVEHEEVDIGFHVRQLLAPLRLHQVLTFEEFREERQKRKQDQPG